MQEKIDRLLIDWHEAGRAAFERAYKSLNYDAQYPKVAVEKRKYICLDERTTGAYLLEKATGNIYRIKSKYGVPNFKKLIGHIDTVTGADLARNRWY
uniref:Uncharacterized protein n=1 Tax=viral metagenome TaxID=1070528 RepID=A0A6M3LW79_9ZZZZ